MFCKNKTLMRTGVVELRFQQFDELPCHGRVDLVRLDPAATARSGTGPAAYGEYERVFGSRMVG